MKLECMAIDIGGGSVLNCLRKALANPPLIVAISNFFFYFTRIIRLQIRLFRDVGFVVISCFDAFVPIT